MLKSCVKHRWTGAQGTRCPLCPKPRNGSTHAHRNARRRAFERDGHQCVAVLADGTRCPNTTALQADHIVQRSEGGADADWNYRTLCEAHHRQRHGN